MKDEEGLFYFLFLVPCPAFPCFRAVSPPFCDSIDCIIPRVRYLSMPVSYQYRGDPKSMNKARRDAAGPHFFGGCGVWNGRYLNILVIINKVLRTILFFLSTCCRFFIPVEFVVYLFFLKRTRRTTTTTTTSQAGRGVIFPCRIASHNQEPSTHPPTHSRPCPHHPTPSTTTSKRMSESSTQAVHTAAESSQKEKKRKSTQAFPTQMESEAQFQAKVSPMAIAGMRKCSD